MKYYTIQENNLLIADNKTALTKYYNNVLLLPEDYEQGKYIIQDGELILNPDFEKEEKQQRIEKFNKEFFETSLGYIRRKVKMADNSYRDFLSDLLPTIAIGFNMGQIAQIITYEKPSFDHDIEDWTKYQYIKPVTANFIQECFSTLNEDFLSEEV